MSLPGRFVDTSAGRLFVHRTASKRERARPPVVLIHGFLMSHYYFRDIIPALAAERDVVTIDLPGHGESDRLPPQRFPYDFGSFAKAVGEALDALDLPEVAIVGHSLGGGVAIALAARQPARVERLVLLAASVYPLPLPPEAQLMLVPAVGRFVWNNLYRKSDMKRYMQREDVRDPALITDEFIDYYWERFNRAGGRDAGYTTLQALMTLTQNNPDPGRVRAPTLLVWGDEDRAVPLSHGKRLSRMISGARLEVLSACGHMAHMEKPDELLKIIVPFLDDAQPQEIADATAPSASA